MFVRANVWAVWLVTMMVLWLAITASSILRVAGYIDTIAPPRPRSLRCPLSGATRATGHTDCIGPLIIGVTLHQQQVPPRAQVQWLKL
eukprot:COSAG05_NODE_3865_length_1798_cov_4.480283_1_plen_88_part_00